MSEAISDWQAGHVEPPDYDQDVAEARRLFARLVSTPVEWVAVGSQVSALVGLAEGNPPTRQLSRSTLKVGSIRGDRMGSGLRSAPVISVSGSTSTTLTQM